MLQHIPYITAAHIPYTTATYFEHHCNTRIPDITATYSLNHCNPLVATGRTTESGGQILQHTLYVSSTHIFPQAAQERVEGNYSNIFFISLQHTYSHRPHN